ncbi:T9SS type A sorting domain-containing protein [Hymenobacter terricola]|uniref:T9SS type A sorting domain-containing protein n=1 Tax=Hymenobacter terricola TaxID=2819236 RepID=UPI001B30B352|nr:T9SS type A sorting domain-containing protein [Hymenobacter terricola]
MKLFTRLTLLSALVLGSWSSAFAVDVVVQVGPNGANTYSPANITIRPGDVVVFTWVSGVHPTVSDSSPAAWAIFTPGSGAAATTRVANLPVGVYPYHCSAHAFQSAPGQPYQGMIGTITVALASAATDAQPTATLNVYPNPSHGQVTVQLSQKAGQSYVLRLSNIIGQEVRTIALRPELTSAGLPLDLGDLRTGVYFYSLLVDGKVVSTKRLVLQN